VTFNEQSRKTKRKGSNSSGSRSASKGSNSSGGNQELESGSDEEMAEKKQGKKKVWTKVIEE
jgi:hypothetical protein